MMRLNRPFFGSLQFAETVFYAGDAYGSNYAATSVKKREEDTFLRPDVSAQVNIVNSYPS
jgi:hypothetical protein